MKGRRESGQQFFLKRDILGGQVAQTKSYSFKLNDEGYGQEVDIFGFTMIARRS